MQKSICVFVEDFAKRIHIRILIFSIGSRFGEKINIIVKTNPQEKQKNDFLKKNKSVLKQNCKVKYTLKPSGSLQQIKTLCKTSGSMSINIF